MMRVCFIYPLLCVTIRSMRSARRPPAGPAGCKPVEESSCGGIDRFGQFLQRAVSIERFPLETFHAYGFQRLADAGVELSDRPHGCDMPARYPYGIQRPRR